MGTSCGGRIFSWWRDSSRGLGVSPEGRRASGSAASARARCPSHGLHALCVAATFLPQLRVFSGATTMRIAMACLLILFTTVGCGDDGTSSGGGGGGGGGG